MAPARSVRSAVSRTLLPVDGMTTIDRWIVARRGE
jgi:hypothetical protein